MKWIPVKEIKLRILGIPVLNYTENITEFMKDKTILEVLDKSK